MGRERVGYRRLYDAIGCSLADGTELRLQFPMRDGVSAEVYLGPKPQIGISLSTASDTFLVPGEQLTWQMEHQADASQSSYPRHFFAEVCCLVEIDVSDELSAAFRRDEEQGKQQLLAEAEKREDDLRNAADFLAGVVGLKFHRQFVIKVVSENFYALRADAPVLNAVSPWVERLDALSLNAAGAQNLARMLTACGAADAAVQRLAGSVLHWLLRAWNERDSVGRFLWLFVPLERILDGYGRAEPSAEWEQLRRLAGAHAADARTVLLGFIDRMKRLDRPSLAERFEAMARESGQAGWESDVKAFRKFNGLRNALLHQGDPRVRLHVTIGEDETMEMSDLVERYVCWRFFGDSTVYPSRWRTAHRSVPPPDANSA